MKHILPLFLLAAAAVQTHAATVTLFHETFDGNLQNWSYTSSAARDYDNTWTEGDTVKPGYKGIKLGSTSVTGSITSESFSLDNTTEAVSITIVAAAYSNNGGGKEGIAVTVYDSSDAIVFSDTVGDLTQHTSTAMDEIPTTADYTKVFTIPAASLPSSGGIHLKIESTYTKSAQRRALLGDVLVTQADSSGVNTPPEATQPSMDVDATVDTEVSVDLASCFTDADGDQLSFALVSGDGYLNGSVWSFTPNYEGSFSAEVSATDPSGDSATMTINVTAAAPSLMPLSAPWIEQVYPEDVTTNGFILRWMAVDNAVGYDLVVTNVAEQMEAGCQVSYSGPNYPDDRTVTATVTGLDPDTLYAVAVRALADANSTPSTGYSDSEWSAPVEIATTLEGGLKRAVLLDEGFSGAGNAWGNTSNSAKPGDEETDCDPWSFSANCYNARSAVKVGGASAVGWALSPEITLSNEVASANIVLSFSAAAYPAKFTKFSVSIVDSTTGETNAIASLADLSPTALSSTSAPDLSGCSDYEVSIFAPTRFKLLFETISSASDKRLLLDSIKVTQVYDPNYAVLPVPTGVVESEVGKYGFTVSWTGVANATGYEVWLDGASHGSCASTDTSMELTGLSDGTTYSVQVKALGDNLHVGDSLLSTAISVTTLADAQKIDFTVTGAPAGDVFAGDAVSFTVTAENEATHAAAAVSFSGIAAATFNDATGAFSWTPTEGDVGSHTATFTSGDYSTNVTITVVSALKTETLASEYFSEIKSSSWTSTSSYASELEGDMGLWTGLDIIKTKAAVIIGRAGSSGNAVSPAVELKVRTPGSLSVSFDTGSLSNKTASVKASILDAADGRVLFEQTFASLASLPVDATAVSDAGAHFTLAPGSSVALPAAVKVKFESLASTGDNSQRAYVDTVVFAQTVSSRIRDLAPPTGLAEVPESVTTNGFSVAWSAVSGATNYAVRVTDAAGSVVFSAPFCATTQATVTGLADDVVYGVQVRATGNEATCFASPWSDALAVRTARSPLHPTLTLGAWQNAVGDGKVYGGLANTAAVSAERSNGEAVVVTLTSVLPAPAVGPTLEDGVLSWIPADADTNKTFTISFLMDGTYATNRSFKVFSIDPLAPPTVTVDPDPAWDSFGLSWNSQYRAAGYAVRVWTDCPNPGATATRVEERFPSYYKKGGGGNRPAGWLFHVTGVGYANDTAPVQFSKDGNWMATYNLGGPISSVTFYVKGNSMTDGSTLRAYWAGALSDAEMEDKDNWTNNLLVAVSDLGSHGQTVTAQIPAGADARRIAWEYEQQSGNVGVGQVSIEGEGFSTPRWLTGWGPAAKDVGLAQTCTVAKPRPGKVLGVDPADKSQDLTVLRPNYAEVTVRDAAGATLSTVVEVDVPAPPRSVRATLMVLK